MLPSQIVITLCLSNNRTTNPFGLHVKVTKHENIDENHKTYFFDLPSRLIKKTFIWNNKFLSWLSLVLHEDAKLQ